MQSSALRRLAIASKLYNPAKSASDRLWLRRASELGTYSQFGEDLELLRLLDQPDLYIDVGSNHPFKANNTYLLYTSGWRGLAIDPVRSHIAHHRKVRPLDVCVNGAAGRATSTRTFYEINPSGFSTFDGNAAETLVAQRKGIVVGEYEVPIVQLADAWRASFGTRRPAVLSIDTEGFEEEVLAGADLDALAPEVILVELKMATETAERTSLISLLRSEGYELAATFGVNGLFVPA